MILYGNDVVLFVRATASTLNDYPGKDPPYAVPSAVRYFLARGRSRENKHTIPPTPDDPDHVEKRTHTHFRQMVDFPIRGPGMGWRAFFFQSNEPSYRPPFYSPARPTAFRPRHRNAPATLFATHPRCKTVHVLPGRQTWPQLDRRRQGHVHAPYTSPGIGGG